MAHKPKTWHDEAFFGLHTDLHAGENDTVLGRDLTVEHLVEELGKIKPDFVQCDCKGHPGYTSYPTEVGQASPGIVKDSLRIWREASKQLGIPLIMHYSGVWDTAALKKHPDWGRVNLSLNGKESWMPRVMDEFNRDKNFTCNLSDYTDKYMIPQLLEIIENYDVDGFWVDGESWACAPCYCERCRSGYRMKTGRDTVPEKEGEDGWEEWLAFHRVNFEDHVRRFADAVHARKPGCSVCSNWMYTMRQPDDISVPVDYISGDFEWIWSTARAGVEARFMDSRGIGWDLMAWGFTSHGPMKDWEFKTVPALCQEAAVVMSCGGAFMIYDIPNRPGTLVGWHMDHIAEVARFCRERQDFCKDTHSVPQAAVIHTKEHYYAGNEPLYIPQKATDQVEGALHALLENSLHVDIVSGDDFVRKGKKYPLCVLAEQGHLSDEVFKAAQDYVREGGALIVSGSEHTRKFDEMLGVSDMGRYAGEGTEDSVFIPQANRVVCGIGKWRLVKAEAAEVVQPILYSRDLGDAAQDSGWPAAVIRKYGKGVIAGIFGPVFESYSFSHYPGMRSFIREIIAAMKVEELVQIEAPARVAVTIREKDRRKMVHFVNLGCDQPLSPRNTIVENVTPAGPVKVSMKMETKPAAVCLAPGGQPVRWNYGDGCFSAAIDSIDIYDILVVEKGEG